MDWVAAFGQSPYVAAAANAVQFIATALALLAWWHLACEEPGCVRHGRLEHEGHHYCRKHHPKHRV